MSDDAYTQGKPFDVLNSRGLAGKKEYVSGLERRRDEQAISLLVECLCDESCYLRDQAEQALSRIGASVAPVLLPLLEQGLWYTRGSVARVLGRFGYRPGVPGLLNLGEDANETVAAAACDALVAIGRNGGTISIAQALHRLAPDVRRRRFGEIAARDRHLADRVERMLLNDELMSAEGGESLNDESPVVRAAEDGLEWEVLTGPPASPKRPEAPGSGRAGPLSS